MPLPRQPVFSENGPFDAEERAVICDLTLALSRSRHAHAESLLDEVLLQAGLLDRLGELLCAYPALLGRSVIGAGRRDLTSLVERLSGVTASRLEMSLPTRAITSRALVMGEVNFYRLLRLACDEALSPEEIVQLKPRVDRRLCQCLYTRLAEAVLISIATDRSVAPRLREKAVMSLTHVWEKTTYRVSHFFPLLAATWEARRRVPATLGTLMGTAEMYGLIQAGCDPQFVDYLVRPDHTADEEDAFREFLFGATTEELHRIEEKMSAEGRQAIGREDVPASRLHDCSKEGDPGLAMLDFFLSRHFQATARRESGAPGPKRTAEEYVMLSFLAEVDASRLSMPPP